MKFNYSLNLDDYSVKNALLWGNCVNHFKKVNEGQLGNRIVNALIGVAELLPVVSQITSVFEMIIVNQLADRPQQEPIADHPQQEQEDLLNATAREFISTINNSRFTELPRLRKSEVREFLSRGGVVHIVTEQQDPIALRTGDQVITGCNSGINRSQVAAAVLKQLGADVIAVLAGGDSAMNPDADFPNFADPLENIKDSATNFEAVFGSKKVGQLGSTEFPDFLEGGEVHAAKKFYQNYINKLSATHFVTFGPCVLSALRRLLQREGSLEGFTVTHFPWGDEIAHPPEGVEKYSKEAYELFAEKIKGCFESS